MLPLFENAAVPESAPPAVDVFEQIFWPNYPRQVGKLRAEKAFARAIKKTTITKMLATLEWQKRTTQWRKVDAQGVHTFVPHPATWLNRGSYNDPMPLSMAPRPKPVPVSAAERARFLELRAAIDHRDHLDAMEEVQSGKIYERFPLAKRGSITVTPCPCWKCRSSRGEL